jgi:hypothetical protein
MSKKAELEIEIKHIISLIQRYFVLQLPINELLIKQLETLIKQYNELF